MRVGVDKKSLTEYHDPDMDEIWGNRYLLINFVPSPVLHGLPLTVYLYALIALGVSSVAAIRKSFSKKTLEKAIVYSFIFAGLLFSLRMEYDWAKLLFKDAPHIIPKDSKTILLDSDINLFIESVKEQVPPGASFRDMTDPAVEKKLISSGTTNITQQDYYRARLNSFGKYNLLPFKTVSDGRFAWGYGSTDFAYDPQTGLLAKNGHVLRAIPYLVMTDQKMIFEIVE